MEWDPSQIALKENVSEIRFCSVVLDSHALVVIAHNTVPTGTPVYGKQRDSSLRTPRVNLTKRDRDLMPFAVLTYWNDLVDQLRELVDPPLSSDPFMQYGMNILNGTECADVNGECRYVREMNVNHFFTIAGVFFVIVSFVLCALMRSIFCL